MPNGWPPPKKTIRKSDLVKKIAADAGITTAKAERALESFIDGVTTALEKGKKVTVVGFGSFEVSQRKARSGRNPLTGAAIRIPATKAPKFRAGKKLKDSVS